LGQLILLCPQLFPGYLELLVRRSELDVQLTDFRGCCVRVGHSRQTLSEPS
jgi:hypothetical protein